MSYHQTGSGGPEDTVCQYDGARLWFRGPERSTEKPYVAVAGGTETFGRFVDRPFATVLEERLDRRCLNFGSLFCGVDALCGDTGLQSLLDRADLCVLQAPDILGQSNRFYKVHPRRNDRFLTATDALVSLYPEVDFADVNFVHHLMTLLHRHQDARFEVVVEELRRNWTRQVTTLAQSIQTPIILLHLRVLKQPQEVRLEQEAEVSVRPEMLEAVRPFCAKLVEASVAVSGQSDELEDMLFGTLQQPMAEHMIGPAAHRSIASVLSVAINDLE